MAKVLALDYGQKRTGVAVTDDMQIIASGLKTVETKFLFNFLATYFADEDSSDPYSASEISTHLSVQGYALNSSQIEIARRIIE